MDLIEGVFMKINIDISEVVLKTERLVLRAFKKEDLDDFYEYARVEGVGELAGWCHHDNILESEAILEMFIEGKHDFAIVYNDKVIGSFGLKDYDETYFEEFKDLKVIEIGYVISKDYWGKGFATEATKCVNEYLFNDLKLDAILVGHFDHNERSKRVILKNNFTYLKTIPYTTRMNTIENALMYVLKNS